MKRIIRLTESDLTRIVRRVIMEEESLNLDSTGSSVSKNWPSILSGLKSFNNPKVINFKFKGNPMTSLNWGTNSEQGKDKNWGISLSSDNNFVFLTKDMIQSKVFNSVMGLKPEFNNSNKSYLYTGDMDFSNPSNVISKIKNVILSLG